MTAEGAPEPAGEPAFVDPAAEAAPTTEHSVVGEAGAVDDEQLADAAAAEQPAPEPGAVPEPEPEGEAQDEGPDYLALAQRLQADFDNFRKRSARDAERAEQRGLGKAVKALLPGLDNLERALQAAEQQGGHDELVRGLRLVEGELLGALQSLGVERYAPDGEAFDPTHHEAISHLPLEGRESGTVQTAQAGYRIGEQVLRAAKVVVAA